MRQAILQQCNSWVTRARLATPFLWVLCQDSGKLGNKWMPVGFAYNIMHGFIRPHENKPGIVLAQLHEEALQEALAVTSQYVHQCSPGTDMTAGYARVSYPVVTYQIVRPGVTDMPPSFLIGIPFYFSAAHPVLCTPLRTTGVLQLHQW